MATFTTRIDAFGHILEALLVSQNFTLAEIANTRARTKGLILDMIGDAKTLGNRVHRDTLAGHGNALLNIVHTTPSVEITVPPSIQGEPRNILTQLVQGHRIESTLHGKLAPSLADAFVHLVFANSL